MLAGAGMRGVSVEDCMRGGREAACEVERGRVLWRRGKMSGREDYDWL
jgi:hypothetical protein